MGLVSIATRLFDEGGLTAGDGLVDLVGHFLLQAGELGGELLIQEIGFLQLFAQRLPLSLERSVELCQLLLLGLELS